MTADGTVAPGETAAHHIVPGVLNLGNFGDDARAILSEFKIDINDKDNGVFLPCTDSSTAPGYKHQHVHTEDYLEEVARRLEVAQRVGGSADAVKQALRMIAQELLQATFPL